MGARIDERGRLLLLSARDYAARHDGHEVRDEPCAWDASMTRCCVTCGFERAYFLREELEDAVGSR